jgi:copper homeostasis protein
MSGYLLEVIATSLHDAQAAEAGGAGRIEVCTRLDLAGLTPPTDLVAAIVGKVSIPARVMLRTNDGFSATDAEIREMHGQVAELAELPIEGVVCGFLDSAGSLDFATLDSVLSGVPPSWRLTVHHAFDHALGEPHTKLQAVRDHGRADRVLSQQRFPSGGFQVIAGGGITLENLPEWLAQSDRREFHVGRAARASFDPLSPVEESKVRRLRRILDSRS